MMRMIMRLTPLSPMIPYLPEYFPEYLLRLNGRQRPGIFRVRTGRDTIASDQKHVGAFRNKCAFSPVARVRAGGR